MCQMHCAINCVANVIKMTAHHLTWGLIKPVTVHLPRVLKGIMSAWNMLTQ
jgi:hypothetical protein